ncbi:MAG: hypothetical protein LBC11_04125, partial [Puniceicoccales bacterium]|nr:hypothetical protein [Puniceicoccales bacterium]
MEVETGVRDQIKNLRNEARSNRAARECILTINGRECKVTANPVITGWWIFKRIAKTEITIEFSTLDSRKCEVQFVYNRGRGVNQGIENFIEKLQEIPSAEAGDPKGSQAVPERATTETQPDSGGTSKSTDTSESTDHTSVPSAEVGGSKDSPVTESATVDTTPDSGGTSESTDHTSVPSAEAGGPKGSQAVPESATVESPTGSGGTSESSKPTSVSSTEVGGPKGSQAIPESATVESPTGSGGTSESSKPTSVSSTEVGGPKGSQA